MTDKFWGAMGLSRRAKQLCIGHDEVKTSVKNGKAKLVILTKDASERLGSEMARLTENTEITVIRIEASMSDTESIIGKHLGVFSVTDNGLKDLILSTIKEDSIYGTGK